MSDEHSHGLMNEVLVALLGYTGGLVVETEDSFRVAPENFLAEGEKQMLEKILKVGYLAKKLHDFSSSLRREHLAGGDTPGHYAYAMALRVEDVLEKFRLKVVELEEEIAENPKLQLVDMLAKFQEDSFVLSALHQMMMQVSSRELRGAALLDAMWQTMSRAGGSTLQHCLAWQLEGPGRVFVNQLTAWMAYGRLIDPENEFFIQRCDGQSLQTEGSHGEDLSQPMGPSEAQREWHRLFMLRREAVPKLLSLDTARQVLFTGKAVRVLFRRGFAPPPPERVQDEVDTLRSCFSMKRPSYVLHRSILALRNAVAGRLQDLLREAQLREHLEILKGFYLLGYGAFYQTLLDLPQHALPQRGAGPRGTSSLPSMLRDSGEKALTEHIESSSKGVLDPNALRLQLVPRALDLHFFDARKVKVMAGARVDKGMILLPAHSMAWLQNKVRISGSFQHAFSFQLRPADPTTTSSASRPGEYGARLALCFQPRWSPQDLQKRRHLERGAEEIPEPLEIWKCLGESLTLELQYCVLRSLPQRERMAEVTLQLFSAGASGVSSELCACNFQVPDVDQMIHMVRLWYDSEKMELQVFFGADAVAPSAKACVDLGDMAHLEMGCSYVGFSSLPLEHGREREALRIVTWRHQCRDRLDFDDTSDRNFEDLTLTYQVPWPLPLIVTQSCLERYNRLFQHLLTYRHATMRLQHLQPDADDEERGRLAAALKAQLCFFWTQVLQFFLQDVVEASHQKLLEVVTSSSSFDEVVAAHEEFLSNVTTHFFLEHRELRKELTAALRIAEVFRRAVETAALSGKEMRRLQHDFAETVRSFSGIMLSINRTGNVTMPLLVQLSGRLDFNNYFSGETDTKRAQSWWQKYGSADG